MSAQEKIALVTGANRGIGYAVAEELLRKGCIVVLTARDPLRGKAAAKRLVGSGRIIFHPLDVNDQDSITQAADFVENEFGRLDILVNNAGINYDTYQNVINANIEDVRQTLQTNLLGPWRVVQAFLPLLRNSAAGRIVNVSSGSGSLADQDGSTPGYSLSKLALNGLTLALARQLRDTPILVNAVCPGWVRTDMGGKNAPRSLAEGAEGIVWAAMLDEGAPSGKFFRDGKEIAW